MQVAQLLVLQASLITSPGTTLWFRHSHRPSLGWKGGLMPERGSQTVRRRRLAAELRRLRERTDLTGDEAADLLGWCAGKISRIENHRIGVKPGGLRRLLVYEVEAAYCSELQALVRESIRPSRLESAALRLPDHSDYVSAEQDACTIWFWNPLVVPGLLETEGYAAAVIEAHQAIFRLPPPSPIGASNSAHAAGGAYS
jgi:hypothetical protein